MLTMVATPIGNLGDISQRALAALEAADVVVSEDTRKTGFLLNHFEIKKPQLSFREDNEDRALPRVMEFLDLGKNVVLVTDAGTPAISDPGFTLVRSALEKGIPHLGNPRPHRADHGAGALRAAGAQFHLPRVPAAKKRCA